MTTFLVFKGQMYDESLEKIKGIKHDENIFSLVTYDGEMSFKEKELLNATEAVKLDILKEGKYIVLADIFNGKNSKKFDPDDIDFFISDSKLDEARKIKHLILKKVEVKECCYKDFTVICSDDGLYRTINNLFYSSGVPAFSTYTHKVKNISTDVLRLIIAGIDQDVSSVLNFYNIYFELGLFGNIFQMAPFFYIA
jgi:hypothetical protein